MINLVTNLVPIKPQINSKAKFQVWPNKYISVILDKANFRFWGKYFVLNHKTQKEISYLETKQLFRNGQTIMQNSVSDLIKKKKKKSDQFPLLAAAKSLQSCPTVCDPIDSSPPGSPVPGILQARTLEGVAISFSNALKWKVKVKLLSHVWLLATPWTAAHQAPSVLDNSFKTSPSI